MNNNSSQINTSGAAIVVGSASGALIAGLPGAIIGAILGYTIQEASRCPKCGNKMEWRGNLKKFFCNFCGYCK